jgi:hypothetical protein
VKKRSGLSPGEMAEALWVYPEFRVQCALSGLAETGNPYYAWLAIDVCIEHQRTLPEWLRAYLGECAKRMLSEHAREAGDLRKVLPWALGFPNVLDSEQRRCGPGNLLDPHPRGFERMMFALGFAIRLEKGEEPLEAMRNACNEVFEGKEADADDKTLQRWLLKEFDLERWPANTEQWKSVVREHFKSTYDAVRNTWDKFSRDSDVH